jgi:hypothetical protein
MWIASRERLLKGVIERESTSIVAHNEGLAIMQMRIYENVVIAPVLNAPDLRWDTTLALTCLRRRGFPATTRGDLSDATPGRLEQL